MSVLGGSMAGKVWLGRSSPPSLASGQADGAGRGPTGHRTSGAAGAGGGLLAYARCLPRPVSFARTRCLAFSVAVGPGPKSLFLGASVAAGPCATPAGSPVCCAVGPLNPAKPCGPLPFHKMRGDCQLWPLPFPIKSFQ